MLFLLDELYARHPIKDRMRHLRLLGCTLLSVWSCRLGTPSAEHDFLLINLSLPRSATTSFAGVFGNFRSRHEYMISETINHLLDFREKKISAGDLRLFLRNRAEKSGLQVDSASFFFLAPDAVIDTFPDAYYFFTLRPCESWIVSMVDNSVFAHKMIREGKHTVDISFLDRYSEYFIRNHSHAVFADNALLARQAEHIVSNLARSWGESTLRVLNALLRVDLRNKLVIHISDFNAAVPRFAQLARVPADLLITENLHLNRDRNSSFYTRLLGVKRLRRLCSPWQQKTENWVKNHSADFPDISQL